MNKLQKQLIGLTVLGTIITMFLTGCADVSHVEGCLSKTEHVYGFWGGVWHGMICQFAFFGSLFDDDIAVYAINNNGGWYDFGFVGGLGIMIRLIVTFLKGLFGK